MVFQSATLLPWLKQIQEQQVTMRKYEHTPLLQIQRWSNVPKGTPLCDSIVAFENHPIDSSLGTRNAKAELRDVVHHHAPTGYPLNVMIERVAYRPLRNAPKLAPLITAVGFSFILQNIGLLWLGGSHRGVPDLIDDGRTVRSGPMRDLVADAALKKKYLGV